MNQKCLATLILLGSSVLVSAQSPRDVYKELKSSIYWVQPDMSNLIDLSQVQDVAKEVRPYELKLLAVPSLGASWQKGNIEQRAAFARYVAEKQLNLGDKGIMIVLTRKGISAYNRKIPAADMVQLNNTASKTVTRTNFTPGVIALAKSVRDKCETSYIKTSTVSRDGGIVSNRSAIGGGGSSSMLGVICIGIPVGFAALVGGLIFAGNRAKIKRSRAAAEDRKHQAISAISYLDSYDGLFKMGADADAVRQYRDRMAQSLDAGNQRFNSARTVGDYDQANYAYQQVLQDFEQAKTHVNNLTGGSGVAYTIPPVIDSQRAPLFEPVQGVSYFSSQPSNQLVPVEVNFGGQRRTVMVTPDERDQLMAGQMPQMRGQYGQNGQFMPWYAVQGYDPYRDYNSHNFIWDLVAISAISSMFTPHYGYGWGGGWFGGYGGYGYGGGTVVNNYYGNEYGGGGYHQQGYDNTSGDFNTQTDLSNDNSGDFNFGQSSGSSDSGGGFDFGGGGDSGGGFDFGSGGDSGGGGGDF